MNRIYLLCFLVFQDIYEEKNQYYCTVFLKCILTLMALIRLRDEKEKLRVKYVAFTCGVHVYLSFSKIKDIWSKKKQETYLHTEHEYNLIKIIIYYLNIGQNLLLFLYYDYF